MDSQFDKRNQERLVHKTPVEIESLQSGVIGNARMVNYSDDGLYFEANELFQPGTEVFIGIENSPHAGSVTYECYQAKIRWGKRLKNSPYAYGYGAKYVHNPIEQNLSSTELEDTEDLRSHPRKVYLKPATFRFEDKSYQGFIKDISSTGCFIKHRDFFEVGQFFYLIIPGTKIDEHKMLKVEVVRLSPDGIGVKFKGISKKKCE